MTGKELPSIWEQIGAITLWIVFGIVALGLSGLTFLFLKGRYGDATYFYTHQGKVKAVLEQERLRYGLTANEPVCFFLKHVEPVYLGGGYAPYNVYIVYAPTPAAVTFRGSTVHGACPQEQFQPHLQNLGGGYYVASTFQSR